MRVLRITDVSRAHAGGIARFMGKSGEALARRGVEVEELFAEDLALPPGLRRLRRLAVPWLIAWRVLGLVRGPRRPDVVEIHEPLAAPYAALGRVASRRLPPCVVMSHGLEERGWIAQRERLTLGGRQPSLKSRFSVPLTLLSQARIALRHASQVMVLSTQDAEFLATRRWVPRGRVGRVNGGAEAELLSAERSACAAPRLLFVGSWLDRKGTPELCEAWRRLRLIHPDLRLTLAGTTLDTDRVLRDFAPECWDSVTVVPAINDAQLLGLLTSHDIFVLPSWYEGMPLSMIEAAAGGLACVVTSICGNLDVFRPADPEADGALLIAPHSVDAIVNAVRTLADDPVLRARLGENARFRAASFTWDHTADQLLDVYWAALDDASEPRSESDDLQAPDAPTVDGDLPISVLIATWRRPEALLGCLASLDAQIHPAAEVVVVVRAADTPTWEALASVTLAHATLRTLSVDAPGVVAALNAGLDAASGAIVAITDDDAAPRPDWLALIHEHLRRQPDVGAVGGRDWVHPQPEVAAGEKSVVGRLLPFGRLVGNHHLGSGGARDVDVLKGVNLALRRSALGARRLDERLRGDGAQVHWELDLCLALKGASWRVVYDPAVAVDHHPGERFGKDQRDDPPLDALADEVHNEMYALLRWLPVWRKIVALTYGVTVGSRRAPGFAMALERWVLEGDKSAVGARLLMAQRARLEARLTARTPL